MTETRSKTAADYAATAVAPLLIFLMISSLANFLMLVLYHGSHPQRVAWTVMMFTLGTVGIGRLAIEKDRAYSLGYAGVLGLVAFVAMLRFVDSPIFSAFILILIAYLSDRIVHDCTLIDDSVDASGQGLIDSGRLFVKKRIEAGSTSGAASRDEQQEPIKATRGTRQNQPGRTVMYLALAALPLFGLGQFFLREDAATWRRAQWLLGLYLFASLSLLVTTSFLGLRRYLRQRRVDMPADVTVAWLAGGLVMIAAILMVAYLAPLPGQAIASFQLPSLLDSPGGLGASRFGWGDEAAERSDPAATSTQQDPNQDGKEVQSMTSEKGAPAGDSGDGDREDGPPGQSKGGNKPAQGAGDSPSDSQSNSQSQSKDQSSDDSGSTPSKSQSGRKSQSDANSSQQPNDKSQPSGGEQSQSQPDSTLQPSQSDSNSKQGEGDSSPPQEDAQSKSEKQSPQNNDTSSGDSPADDSNRGDPPDSGFADPISNVIPTLSGMLRFIIFLALASIVAAFLWLNRAAILAWWQSLTASQPKVPEESFDDFLKEEAKTPPRAFSSYRNPFGSEADPRRIVVITFAAFEAWTREQGATRTKNETPSEFIRRVAGSLPTVSADATRVVDSYNRIVYGRGNASKRDLQAASQMWDAMQKNLAVSR